MPNRWYCNRIKCHEGEGLNADGIDQKKNRHPLYIDRKKEPYKEPSKNYVGRTVTVTVNPSNGNIVTAHSTNRKDLRNGKDRLKIPKFTKEQKDFLHSLCPDLDFEHMERFSDDDWYRAIDKVEDELMVNGLEVIEIDGQEDYKANEIGVMCYSILDNEDL